MENLLNSLKVFFTKYPEYIYLIIGIVFFILFMGTLKDKKWAVTPQNMRQKDFYNTFGHKAFRIFIIGVYLVGIIAGFGGFLLYLFYY